MKIAKVAWLVALVSVLALLLAACGGGGGGTGDGGNAGGGEGEPAGPTATPDPLTLFPDTLPVHPEAFDIRVTEVSQTYSYQMPGLTQDAVDYLEPELEKLGWQAIGKPTIMGHIATFVMEREGIRLNVSLQDNERTSTTRVQMLLQKK